VTTGLPRWVHRNSPAGFLIPYLRPGAMALDCGCGAGTITLGLAEAVPEGHVIGIDLDLSGLKGAQRAVVLLGQQNLSWIAADGRSLRDHPRRGTDRRSPPLFNIRQQLWRAAGIAEPSLGRRLRGLFQAAGFGHVEAFAKYINYGTPERVRAFASDRAAECRDRELHAGVTRYGIASTEELLDLAAAWEK
jgi:Methyltransferase domain